MRELEAKPGDLFEDGSGKLWRCTVRRAPTLRMVEVDCGHSNPLACEDEADSARWEGFSRLVREDGGEWRTRWERNPLCSTCQGTGEIVGHVSTPSGQPVEKMLPCPDCGLP